MSHTVAICAFLLLAACIGFVLWITTPRKRGYDGQPDAEHTPFFFIPMALLIVFGAWALVQSPEPGETLAHVNELVIDIGAQCPPGGPQHTDVLSITVNVGHDGSAELLTCARMLKRPYQQKMRWTRQLVVSKE